MNKYLKIIAWVVVATALFAEDYNIEDKTVVGEDKRKYNEKTFKITGELENNSKSQLELKEKEVDFLKDFESSKIEVYEGKENEADLKYNIILYGKSTPQVIVEEKENIINKENYFLFGTGGYEKIDAFKYILNYTKQDTEREIDYFLHLGRDIRGEDRKNSDKNTDNYFGKIWYKNMGLSLSHIIKAEEFPGMDKAPVAVGSVKDYKATKLNLDYNIIKNTKQTLKTGIEIYEDRTNSSTARREYDSKLYSVGFAYDVFTSIKSTENFIKTGIRYSKETVEASTFEEKINLFRIEAEDKIKFTENKNIDFELGLNTEITSGSRKDTSFGLRFGMNKYFNENTTMLFNIGKINERIYSREISKKLRYDEDILPVDIKNLKPEDRYYFEAGAAYTGEGFYIEAKARHISAKDKLIYEENSNILLANESLICADNLKDDKNWQELELKGSFTFSEFKSELNYIYSTIKDVPFEPVNKAKADIIYEKNKYEGKIGLNLETKSYTDRAKTNRTGNITTVDFLNSYHATEYLILGLNIYNLLNSKEEYKTGYKISERKISLEIKINY